MKISSVLSRSAVASGLATTLTLATTSLLILPSVCQAGVPAPEQFFDDQLVDHLDANGDGKYSGMTWSHRYYVWEDEFQGPGHPIFIIMGGEGHIPPETGLYYPFVTHHLAKIFGAYVFEPEHRFYGKSKPIEKSSVSFLQDNDNDDDEDPRVQLFTSEQALHDYMTLLTHIQESLGCSPDKFSKQYCPVITVGGSYPGFLSALARIIFPHRVDIAYAASAPIYFYSQQVNQYDYYDHITHVVESELSGCSDAVQLSLWLVKEAVLKGYYNEEILGICPGTIPDYILHSKDQDPRSLLVDELMMVVEYTFANDNMANYPPSKNTRLYKACKTFTSIYMDAFDKLREFLIGRLGSSSSSSLDSDASCWNMTSQVPTGPHGTISGGDWSGVGSGSDGESWDFQTCTLEVEAIGFSSKSMFPPRDWSLDWLTNHCQARFGVTPAPYDMVRRWKFNDLVASGVTRIIFTNGLKDGWSVGGIKETLSDTLIAINFPNGAHHSDLSGKGPSDEDTDDIKEGFKTIIDTLSTWLDEIRPPETA